MFLFEKVIIMSKKFEAPSQKKAKKADSYLYKAHIPVRSVCVCVVCVCVCVCVWCVCVCVCVCVYDVAQHI